MFPSNPDRSSTFCVSFLKILLASLKFPWIFLNSRPQKVVFLGHFGAQKFRVAACGRALRACPNSEGGDPNPGGRFLKFDVKS